MTNKIAFSALFALALILNVGCSSSTKTASTAPKSTSIGQNGATDATLADNPQTLPPVGEGPHRGTWGSNISPYAF